MKRLFLLSMCLLSLSTTFAQEADSMKTQHINEVVVTAQNHVAIKDGVSYIPTPEERKSSSNYASLLARMMVAGLRVDEFLTRWRPIGERKFTFLSTVWRPMVGN